MPIQKVDGGDSRPLPKHERDDIKKEPEGWSDIKKKYEERYNERYELVREKLGAKTDEEMVRASDKEVKERRRIHIGEHRKLQDETVLTEPKNPEILSKREEIEQQTSDLYNRIDKELMPTHKNLKDKITTSLKGRVKMGPPENKGGGAPAA